MNDKQYAKSVISDVITSIIHDMTEDAEHYPFKPSTREYLWANKNEKILLPSHSKHPLNGVVDLPPIRDDLSTQLSFNFIMPSSPPPKGQYYAILGSEKRTSTSVHVLIDENGYVKMIYDDETRNDEKIIFYTTKQGSTTSDRHHINETPVVFDGGIYRGDVFARRAGDRTFEYLLADDMHDTIPLPTPIWDIRYSQSKPYLTHFYYQVDDGWSEFPIINDDSNNNRYAITTKTQAADWAGIDHNKQKRWTNWITIGRDNEYYGFDTGWTDPSHKLGRLTNQTTPEGYYIKAMYKKASGENAGDYIESLSAWDAKRNLFTVNMQPDQKRLIYRRDQRKRGSYELIDFGRATNFDKRVNEMAGITIHSKNFAVPEYDKPVYLWQVNEPNRTIMRMVNNGDNPYWEHGKLPTFANYNRTHIEMQIILPKQPPLKNGGVFPIFGVNGHGGASMPLAIKNIDGRAYWWLHNNYIDGTPDSLNPTPERGSKEIKSRLYIDDVEVNHGDEVYLNGRTISLRHEFKNEKSGYFEYIGYDAAYYEDSYRFPTPIYNLHISQQPRLESKRDTILFCDMQGGWTNAPLIPDLSGNGNHIWIDGAERNDFAPINRDGSKDGGNAGKA